MQPQTAECLILAQITSHHLIVVLNKIDAIPSDQREVKVRNPNSGSILL
jgi:selenocysteine-specific translation elongation factor